MEGNFKKWINRINSKQDILTEDNVGQFMDLELATKSTPTYGDTVLGRDSLTGKAVEIPTSSLGGGGSGLALGETSSTAYRGDRGKMAYDHSQTTGNPHGTTKTDIGLGNVDNTSDLNKPISTATQTALDLKLSTEAPSTTGTVISFSTDKVYGTLTTPETGNITADVANAKLGVTNIIIHNSGTAPTFGSEFKKLSGSGNYSTGVVNYIYCTYISTTEIIYSINQRA